VQADEVGLGFPVKIPACDFHDLISVAVARSGCVLEPPDARVFFSSQCVFTVVSRSRTSDI
jgi:hypothetical protein